MILLPVKCRTHCSSLLSTYLRSRGLLSVWILLHLRFLLKFTCNTVSFEDSLVLDRAIQKVEHRKPQTCSGFFFFFTQPLSLLIPTSANGSSALLRERDHKKRCSTLFDPSLHPDVCLLFLTLCAHRFSFTLSIYPSSHSLNPSTTSR